MKPCKCGSVEFDVQAVYAGVDRIRLDGGDLDIIDTHYDDGEWEDHSAVKCAECGKVMTYSEWRNQDE